MFTGIIESLGTVVNKISEKSNLILQINCDFIKELKIDQSIAHNGTCLTVVDIQKDYYEVVLVDETIEKTSFKNIEIGSKINLERCLKLGDRMDGHWVTGHIDQTGQLVKIEDKNGSWKLFFSYQKTETENITVTKGSICINGVSLTVVDSFQDSFSVVLIPYTWENTNLSLLKVGEEVNLEFDILGKYIKKMMKF
ncbi:MAG: riboflavin synthase [Cytophagales bacterium]